MDELAALLQDLDDGDIEKATQLLQKFKMQRQQQGALATENSHVGQHSSPSANVVMSCTAAAPEDGHNGFVEKSSAHPTTTLSSLSSGTTAEPRTDISSVVGNRIHSVGVLKETSSSSSGVPMFATQDVNVSLMATNPHQAASNTSALNNAAVNAPSTRKRVVRRTSSSKLANSIAMEASSSQQKQHITEYSGANADDIGANAAIILSPSSNHANESDSTRGTHRIDAAITQTNHTSARRTRASQRHKAVGPVSTAQSLNAFGFVSNTATTIPTEDKGKLFASFVQDRRVVPRALQFWLTAAATNIDSHTNASISLTTTNNNSKDISNTTTASSNVNNTISTSATTNSSDYEQVCTSHDRTRSQVDESENMSVSAFLDEHRNNNTHPLMFIVDAECSNAIYSAEAQAKDCAVVRKNDKDEEDESSLLHPPLPIGEVAEPAPAPLQPRLDFTELIEQSVRTFTAHRSPTNRLAADDRTAVLPSPNVQRNYETIHDSSSKWPMLCAQPTSNGDDSDQLDDNTTGMKIRPVTSRTENTTHIIHDSSDSKNTKLLNENTDLVRPHMVSARCACPYHTTASGAYREFNSEVIFCGFYAIGYDPFQARPAYFGTYNYAQEGHVSEVELQAMARAELGSDMPRVSTVDYDYDSGDDWDSVEGNDEFIAASGSDASDSDVMSDSLSSSERDFINDDDAYGDEEDSDCELQRKMMDARERRLNRLRSKDKLIPSFSGPFVGIASENHPLQKCDKMTVVMSLEDADVQRMLMSELGMCVNGASALDTYRSERAQHTQSSVHVSRNGAYSQRPKHRAHGNMSAGAAKTSAAVGKRYSVPCRQAKHRQREQEPGKSAQDRYNETATASHETVAECREMTEQELLAMHSVIRGDNTQSVAIIVQLLRVQGMCVNMKDSAIIRTIRRFYQRRHDILLRRVQTWEPTDKRLHTKSRRQHHGISDGDPGMCTSDGADGGLDETTHITKNNKTSDATTTIVIEVDDKQANNVHESGVVCEEMDVDGTSSACENEELPGLLRCLFSSSTSH